MSTLAPPKSCIVSAAYANADVSCLTSALASTVECCFSPAPFATAARDRKSSANACTQAAGNAAPPHATTNAPPPSPSPTPHSTYRLPWQRCSRYLYPNGKAFSADYENMQSCK
eukprot:3819583-Pleurochrysis_carterae.AAC.3